MTVAQIVAWVIIVAGLLFIAWVAVALLVTARGLHDDYADELDLTGSGDSGWTP